jgi:GTPase SAR1 family protein
MFKKYINDRIFTDIVDRLRKSPVDVVSIQVPDLVTMTEEEQYGLFLRRLEMGKAVQAEVCQSTISSSKFISLEDTIKQTYEAMALSGRVNPKFLFSHTIEKGESELVLNILSKDCIIEAQEDVLWFLVHKKRLEVLTDLSVQGRLQARLSEALPTTDDFGHYLRDILSGSSGFESKDITPSNCNTIINVLETVSPVPGLVLPSISSVRNELTEREYLTDFAILSNRFIGREKELSILSDFAIREDLNAQAWRWEGLLLTGLGGVGKTTLLAKFVLELLTSHQATTVLLDFDRPGIDMLDTTWLELEISNQVGRQYLTISSDLEHSRSNAFENQEEYGVESRLEQARSFNSVISDVREMLLRLRLQNKPFILILDTVEEVSQRALISNMHEWLNDLCSYLSPIPLKVVISGRLFENQMSEVLSISKIPTKIELKEFDAIIAESFLIHQGLSESDSSRLVALQLLPLRPLELKLIAKLINNGSTSIEQLEQDFKNADKSQNLNDLFVSIVYQRVLRRLHGDPLLSKLAYPGLILRFITPDIIKFVLRPALRLGEISDEKSNDLTEMLWSFSWLAYKSDTGEVWHRKDIRRTMLKLMIGKEPKKVASIRAAAIKYFENVNTPKTKAEALYHKLMMVKDQNDTVTFDLPSLKVAYPFIAVDIADLPIYSTVVLNYAVNNRVNVNEWQYLPDKFFATSFLQVGSQLVKNRQFVKALEVYSRAKALSGVTTLKSEDFQHLWIEEMLFTTVNWSDLTLIPKHPVDKILGLFDLYSYLFPRAFVFPESIDPKALDTILNRSRYRSKAAFHGVSSAQNITYLNRLAYCSANLRELGGATLHPDLVAALMETIKGNADAASEKGLFILSQIYLEAKIKSYRLGVSFFKLNSVWLEDLSKKVEIDHVGLLQKYSGMLRKGRKKAYSSRTLLAAIDGSKERRQWKDIKLDLTGMTAVDKRYFLYGPDVVFRDPCRYAIIEAFSTHELQMKLAEIAQSIIEVDLTDLDAEFFSETLNTDAELTLEPIVELIDRSWALGDFLRKAFTVAPHPKIKEVLKCYEKWENTYGNYFK